MSNPTGRPRIVPTPEEFERRADAYFAEREEAGKPATITGLTLALGFSSIQSLHDYADYPGFSEVVKKARLRVEHSVAEHLWAGNNPTGSIFYLKCQNGWKDKPQEAAQSPAEIAAQTVALIEAMREADAVEGDA